MWRNEIFGFCLLLHPFAAYSFDCIKEKEKAMETKLTTPIKWIDEAIKVHNKYRAEHDASPLKFNASLCRSAQWTANKNLEIGFMHTSKMPEGYTMYCGENLYTAAGATKVRLPHETIDPWYAEEFYYDYQNGKSKVPEKPVGHFTQLVWKASKEFCIAYAVQGPKFFVAAHYFPRGNVRKRYVENVGLRRIPQGDKPKVSLNPWLELLCDKLSVKPGGRSQFKCHYKGIFSQLSPKTGLSLSRKESQKLMNRVLESKKFSAFIEAPLKKS